jgi:prolyl-tRNA synthetase
MRWEKRTRLFLRTSEFLWQEGHTAHETEKEAVEETMRMLGVYKDVAERFLCLPVIAGRKSEAEKFAGAVATYCIEAMMQDRKALQAGTSHFLGQNFGKAFDVQFQSREGKLEYAWATSWGVSTRLIGAIIMTHSDDKGLVLPPTLAPDQAVIVPILKKDSAPAVLAYCEKLLAELKAAGIRAILDGDDTQSPGWKFAEHEMNGVCLRIEVGPRDMAEGKAMVVRRDTGEKVAYEVAGLPATALGLLDAMQKNLYDKALAFRKENTKRVADRAELLAFYGKDQGDEAGTATATGGFAEGLWCGDRECEAALKAETKVTIRCLPLEGQDHVDGKCCLCGKPARHLAVFARNY